MVGPTSPLFTLKTSFGSTPVSGCSGTLVISNFIWHLHRLLQSQIEGLNADAAVHVMYLARSKHTSSAFSWPSVGIRYCVDSSRNNHTATKKNKSKSLFTINETKNSNHCTRALIYRVHQCHEPCRLIRLHNKNTGGDKSK